MWFRVSFGYVRHLMEFEDIVFDGRYARRPISPFTYSPLDHRRNELRLIRLHLSPVGSAPVEVTLEHHSLLDPPDFIALSYEWGHPGEYALITMNGVAVPVTRNLCGALQQLREHRWTLLWIDALCINQRSEEERSAQILRMAAIYQEAQRVGVWLGPEFEGSGRVMRFLRSLYNANQTGDNRFMDLARPMKDDKRSELQSFFDRSYWTRVWIIQEIVVGSQVSILCGCDILEWEELNEAILTPLFKQWERNLQLKECHNLCNIRSKDVLGVPTSLLEALHASSLSQSAEPKDKVFGVLGLAFDRRVYLTEPQYGWNEFELCMRMTKSFIARKRSLDIIFIGSERSAQFMEDSGNPAWTLQLPSWCPNYIHFPSTPRLRHLISYVSGQDQRIRTGTLGRRWLSTDTSIATPATCRVTSHYLQVKALPIGYISALAKVLGEKISPRYDAHFSPGSGTSSNKTSTGDALSRMLFLLYNKDYDRHIATRRQNSQAFRSLLFHFDSTNLAHEKLERQFDDVKKWRDLNKDFSIVGRTLKGRCPEDMPLNERVKPLSNLNSNPAFVSIVESLAEKYRMPSLDIQGSLSALADLIGEGLRLMTTSQRSVGWAHPDATLRDEIFLIPGCSMPAILRRQDGAPSAHLVVGHAYVDG